MDGLCPHYVGMCMLIKFYTGHLTFCQHSFAITSPSFPTLNLLVPSAYTSIVVCCLEYYIFRGEGKMKSERLYEGLLKQYSNA